MAGSKGVLPAAVLVGFFGILPLARMVTEPTPLASVAPTVTVAVATTTTTVAPTGTSSDQIAGLSDAIASLLREQGVAQQVSAGGGADELSPAVVKLLAARGAVLAVPESESP